MLDFGDRKETRVTDRPVTVGSTVSIEGRFWEIVERLERAPSDARETARFLCRLTRSQRDRAAAMRLEAEKLRERVDRLQERMADQAERRRPA